MEAPETPLEVFSAVLIEEYVRLMTAADYLQHPEKSGGTKFKISSQIFEKLHQEELHYPLIGLKIDYTDDVLTAVPDDEFLAAYDNKIMKEVVLLYAENYKNRYKNFINVLEEN